MTECCRCGYCCFQYDVIIIHPDTVANQGNNINVNRLSKNDMMHKESGKKCPFFEWDGEVAVCKIHHYSWYENTPCFAHLTDSPYKRCYLGEHIIKTNGMANYK